MPRLLIVHNEYGKPSGEEYALKNIAKLLEANGHQVKWFLRSSADIVGFQGKVHAFFSGIHSFQSVKSLRRLLRHHTYDVAIVQNLYPLLSPAVLSVLHEFRIPVIMRCPNYRLFCPNGLHLSHNNICERCLGGREYWCILKNCENDWFKSTGYALRNMMARLSRRIVDSVDIFVVLSEFQRNRFIEGGIPAEKLEILPNMISSSSEPPDDEPGIYVSFVGRISPEKGVDDFLAAASCLPDIRFAIAGDYEQAPDLYRNSPVNVKWMGFLGGGYLENFYRQSRLLVFPGKWFEGFPNVIASAMAAGKPVIAARLGAIPEIVDHERTGLLFEPGNIPELAKHIKRLYSDKDLCLRFGQAGREKAARIYSQDAVYTKLEELINKARHAHPPHHKYA